jgi:hypothetical protein
MLNIFLIAIFALAAFAMLFELHLSRTKPSLITHIRVYYYLYREYGDALIYAQLAIWSDRFAKHCRVQAAHHRFPHLAYKGTALNHLSH